MPCACCILLCYLHVSDFIYLFTFLHLLWANGTIKTLGIGIGNREVFLLFLPHRSLKYVCIAKYTTQVFAISVSCRMLRACCILLSYIRISELLAGHYMLLICFLTGDLFLHMLWAKGIIKTLGIGIANRAAVFSITEKHGFGVLHCAACQGHLDICLLTMNFLLIFSSVHLV